MDKEHPRVTREQVSDSVHRACDKPTQAELMAIVMASPWYINALASLNLSANFFEEHLNGVPEEAEAAYKLAHEKLDGPLASLRGALDELTEAVIDMRFDAVNCQCPTCKAEYDELPGQDRAGTDPNMN